MKMVKTNMNDNNNDKDDNSDRDDEYNDDIDSDFLNVSQHHG